MTDQEYNAIQQRLERGEDVGVVAKFLYDQERQRRAAGPNILQQQEAARRENPLLQPNGAKL